MALAWLAGLSNKRQRRSVLNGFRQADSIASDSYPRQVTRNLTVLSPHSSYCLIAPRGRFINKNERPVLG